MARGTIQYAASGKFASTGVDDNGDATTLTIDANENLGIGGVSPIGTHSTLTSVRVGGNAIINHTTASAASGSLDITQNANYDTDGSWEYIVTDEVSRYQQSGGEHIFSAAASGTAGNDVTWVEALRIKADGNVLIGGSSTAESLIGVTPTVQVEGLGYADSSISAFNNSNDANGAYLYLGKSRGTSLNSDVIVQDGDTIGGINFVAADGVDRVSRIAGIFALVDGTPGADDTPGELTFFTTSDGAQALGSAAMVIKADNKIGIGTTAPSTGLHVYDGTAVATLTVSGSGTGYTNAELVLEALTGNNERSTGVFMHDAGSDIEWFMGRRYDSTDNFQIARKTSLTSHSASVSQAANALLTIDNTGRVGIASTAPTQTLTVDGTVGGTAVKDEDNMSSNSATHLATQQSIKAYVDTQIAANSGGSVLFKSAGKAGGNPGSGKTWVAFGYSKQTDSQNYVTATVSGSVQSTYARGFGYGYGDVVSINTGSGFTDYIPSGSSATWVYTLEFDDA